MHFAKFTCDEFDGLIDNDITSHKSYDLTAEQVAQQVKNHIHITMPVVVNGKEYPGIRCKWDSENARKHLRARYKQLKEQVGFDDQRLYYDKSTGGKKKAIAVVGAVYTAPRGLREGDEEKFFEIALEFHRSKFPRECEVGYVVHYDEGRGHMQVYDVPIVDEIERNPGSHGRQGTPKIKRGEKVKTGRRKVSAKEFLHLGIMRGYHKQLQKHVDKALGYHVEILLDSETKTRERLRESEEYRRKLGVALSLMALDRDLGKPQALERAAELLAGKDDNEQNKLAVELNNKAKGVSR